MFPPADYEGLTTRSCAFSLHRKRARRRVKMPCTNVLPQVRVVSPLLGSCSRVRGRGARVESFVFDDIAVLFSLQKSS